jgi:2-polyprenyl-3-methyl-5-hydroxy-6-metoxy-1,4-benzoquinol methylase
MQVDTHTAAALTRLNQQFYREFADQFSQTRQRLQPGVLRLLEGIQPGVALLDLGCGNGELGLELAARGHHGGYTGLDFSPGLLEAARRRLPDGYPARLYRVDLSAAGWEAVLEHDRFEIVTAFAVLHHIPGEQLRTTILRTIHHLLQPAGRLLLSNWQFLGSEKLRSRILPWEAAGLEAAVVDEGDYLLDWRSGGLGQRYVRHFSEQELLDLAEASQFVVRDQFFSDGEGGRLGLYQVWEKA